MDGPSGAQPVIRSSAFCLAHVPELVRYGSKPTRELVADPGLAPRLEAALRPDADAVAYPPNQVFIGGLSPDALAELPRPWHATRAEAPRRGPFGEILDQETFYALLARSNVLDPPLVELPPDVATRLEARLAEHPFLGRLGAGRAGSGAVSPEPSGGAATLPIYSRGEEIGRIHGDERAEGRDDPNLRASFLLENLCTKASGAFALASLLERAGLDPGEVDFIIGCGEEASGDRYQRGGGGVAKSIGELCGCANASGMDVKNFCAAPASAIVTAGALVRVGLFRRIVVVGGGSLAKLGMKLQACLAHGVPILEDCLASLAVLITGDDGRSPLLRLEPGAIGIAPIGASTSDEAVYRRLLLGPLEALGLRITDVDRYAPELHNPELMEFAGSGDVAHKNYRSIAAMGVVAGHLARSEMEAFIRRVGMPGFAPTQGHVPSGVPFLPHAAAAMERGEIRRVMVLSKASLFLSRLTELFDGVSFLVETNPDSAGGRS